MSSLIPPQGGLGVLADVQQTDLTQHKMPANSETNPPLVPANGGILAQSAQSLQRRNMNMMSSQQRALGSANNAGQTAQFSDQQDEGLNQVNRQPKTASGSRT